MNEVPLESMGEGVLGTVPDAEWLRSVPRPISLSFSWEAIVAAIVVGTTMLALDFLSFRATELNNARRYMTSGQEQQIQLKRKVQKGQKGKKRQQAPTSSNGNPHHRLGASAAAVISASRSSEGNGGVGGGGNGSSFMAVRRGARSTGGTDESRVHLKRSLILAVWILGAIILHRMGLTILARSSATIASLVACLPYLLRSSKYRRDSALGCVLEASDKRRSVTDMLVWTSFVYVLPSVYGLYVHQYGIAALQLMTTIGSTLFHLTRETKFFNLDNVFATSLLLTTMWALFLAATQGVWWYVAVVGLGGPFAIFCIVRCGMPGLVYRHPSGHGLCRVSNPEYDFFHMLWHLSSGLGTLISIHYFEVNFPAEEAGGGWFHYFPDIPVVPTVCLAISALINLYGNRVGMMPLE